MAGNVKITSKGIQKVLRNYNPKLSLSEYLWNGFDAQAKRIDLNYKANALGRLAYIEVADDGYGIDFEKLDLKFNPFYDSEKTIEISNPKHTSAMHGRNGVGRLTFFTFANSAEWVTTYNQKGDTASARILITTNTLNSFKAEKINSNSKNTGTTVTFSNIQISLDELESSIIPFLTTEFCWFLELNKNKGFSIYVNGKQLDYSDNIIEYLDNESFVSENGFYFKFKYVQWQEALHKELSKYYFINSRGNEVYKEYTTLNNKGDQFYHSVYIESEFFDEFDFKSLEFATQQYLFGKARSSSDYKSFIYAINKFLKSQRKPFLREYASVLVNQFEREGIFPSYKNEWEEKYKKPQLQETLIGLYEAQPKLFSSLNVNQKKTFVRLLDLLLDSNERDNLFILLEEIIELDSDEREDLAKLFKTTRLTRIIETIKMIEDRYKTYYQLKELVFNPDLKADEVHHLQKMIECHYWIFGEQYQLITAAEPKFEEALRRFVFHLTDKDTSSEIEHPHKLKEMDIFACRQNILADKIENIVVELKHPLISLGENQYSQVHKYLQVITSQPEFNASNMSWEFYLVGKKFDKSKYIEDIISSNRNHGLQSLALWKDDGRVKVYVKTWSEIFADFEIKHNYIDKQLKFEREQLVNELKSADEIISSAQENSAVQPKEIKIPK